LEYKKTVGVIEEDLRPLVHEALKQLDWDYAVLVPFASELKSLVDAKVLRSPETSINSSG
jgi:hypothetical protein